ncbi:MAG: hypothetical protein RLZZ342_504 [Candidatus Parcubacteria bacterium]
MEKLIAVLIGSVLNGMLWALIVQIVGVYLLRIHPTPFTLLSVAVVVCMVSYVVLCLFSAREN